MSYIIHKSNTFGVKVPTITNSYNGEAEYFADTVETLPFETYESESDKSFSEETGFDYTANGNYTTLYIQFDKGNDYPTNLTINGTNYSNTGYIKKIESLSITSGQTIQIRFTATSQASSIIKVVGISNTFIEEITDDKVISIDTDESIDPLSFKLPISYCECVFKSTTIYPLSQGDEINIYYANKIMGRYYVKKVDKEKDNNYRIYCEDIVGILDKIDGGTTTLSRGTTESVAYQNTQFYKNVLKELVDGFIFDSYYAYRMFATLQNLTIREAIQQICIAQISLFKKETKFNRDFINITTTSMFDIESMNEHTFTEDQVDIGCEIKTVPTIKKLTIDFENEQGEVTTYEIETQDPQATEKYYIKPKAILINGTDGSGTYALNDYLTAVIHYQSGQKLKCKIYCSANDIKYTEVGRSITVQTNYGNIQGLVTKRVLSLTRTAVAEIELIVNIE